MIINVKVRKLTFAEVLLHIAGIAGFFAVLSEELNATQYIGLAAMLIAEAWLYCLKDE